MSTGAPHIHSPLAALFIQSADDQFSRRSTITSIREKDCGQTERHLSPSLFRQRLSPTTFSHCREKSLISTIKPDVHRAPAVHLCGGIPCSQDVCVCNFLAVYFLFLPLIHTWPYVGNWTAAGSNNLHRVLARVIGLTAFGCCSWFLRGYVLLRLSTVPVSKIRSWVWYSPPPQFSMCLEIAPQP